MSTLPYEVDFRGHPACPCLAEWLPVYEAELLRRGVIQHNIDIYQLIGGAAASAGTHSKGGAYDLAQVTPEAIKVAREMGAAAWHRPVNWDGAGGIEHHHGVLVACPHNEPARYQIAALEAGYNGLGHLGEGGKDTGPRSVTWPLPTWRQGIAWAKKQQVAAKKKAKPKPTPVQAANTGAKQAVKQLQQTAQKRNRPGVVATAKAILKKLAGVK